MLLNMTDYHSPVTLAEAVSLLRRTDRRTQVIAGGTELAGRHEDQTEALIDLSRLGLDTLQSSGDELVIGAMVTLRQIVADRSVLATANGLLARAAHLSAPATIRAAATLGGTLAGLKGGEEIPTALLALGARVRLMCDEVRELPVAEFLAGRTELLKGRIITGVVIPAVSPETKGGLAWVARTPADRAIVVAAAVIRPDGEEQVAVGGVTAYPRRWPIGGGEPTVSDLRAGAVYRRWVAPVLADRALQEALGGTGT